MKNLFKLLILLILLNSCTSSNNVVYLQDLEKQRVFKNNEWYIPPIIRVNDVLKIDVLSDNLQASLNYNKIPTTTLTTQEAMQLDGYLVSDDYNINFPILGEINVKNMTLSDLENTIEKKLLDDNHLIRPNVNVRLINFKFTILGEVLSPGTYSTFENKLSLLQALGYAGDLTVNAKRNDITLIRDFNGTIKVSKIDLRSKKIFNTNEFYLCNNDVIIVNPNFNKVKSGGFIGSPQSIASISSLILSITLLIINK